MNIIEISDEEWKKNFAELPSISEEEAIAILKEKGRLESQKVPFLNLNRMVFDGPVVIKNCLVDGISAKGAAFHQPVIVVHSLITKAVEFSAWKEKQDFIPTSFDSSLEIRNSRLEDNFQLRNGEVKGQVLFYNCDIQGILCLDRANCEKEVTFSGPGRLKSLTAYRAAFGGAVSMESVRVSGAEDKGLDFNGANLKAGLAMKEVEVVGVIELRKARLGEAPKRGWTAIGCSLEDVDLEETMFLGEVEFSNSRCKNFYAELPKGSHGEKTGKPTTFMEDAGFDKVVFQEKCNFHGARFYKYANFKECQFPKGGVFNQVTFGKLASFWQSESGDSMHFRKVCFSGKANFGNVVFGAKSSFNDATFAEEAAFFDAQALGDIFFSGAHFEKDLVMRKFRCKGGLVLKQITVDGPLNISNSTLEDRLILSESFLNNSLQANGVTVGTWASLDSTVVEGRADLTGIKVGVSCEHNPAPAAGTVEGQKQETDPKLVPGTFYLSKAVFHQPLDLSSANVYGDLCLDSVNGYTEIEVIRAYVGGNITLSKSYFRGTMRFSNCKARELVSLGARYKEEVSFDAMQCEAISLKGSSFDGGFTMRSTVAAKVNLNNVDVDGKADMFHCQFRQLFFNHLLVDYFIIEREALGENLSSEEMGNYPQAKTEYGILKQAFLMQNRYQDMDWAYYRFCRSNRKIYKVSWRNPLRSAWVFFDWLLLDLGFGYGTRPMNIAAVALFVIGCFALVYCAVPQGIADSSGQTLEHLGFLDAMYVSIVTFASMDYGECLPRFHHWLKYLFSVEGVLGIFLTTLFVATISRKLIRT